MALHIDVTLRLFRVLPLRFWSMTCICVPNFMPSGIPPTFVEAMSRCGGVGRVSKELGVRLLRYSEHWTLRELRVSEVRGTCTGFFDIQEESGAQHLAQEVPKIDPKRVPTSTGRGNLSQIILGSCGGEGLGGSGGVLRGGSWVVLEAS